MVFWRLSQGDGRKLPACPCLFDEVLEVPVVPAGQVPENPGLRRRVCVADWLGDGMEDEEELGREWAEIEERVGG